MHCLSGLLYIICFCSLNINGFEEPFIFDTGNVAYPLIIGVNSKIKPISYVTYEGSEGIVASGNLKTDVKYANVNEVNISNFKLNSPKPPQSY